MNHAKIKLMKEIKKEPEHIHKDQTTLQILLPLLIVVLICLAAFCLLVFSTAGKPQSTLQWANISIMFLILPLFIGGLIGLVILILLSKMSGSWNKTLPQSLKNIRIKVMGFLNQIDTLVQKPASPVVGIKSYWAGIKSLIVRKKSAGGNDER